ncbi:FAD/NAD(P)-binding protein [Lentilactobacillus raoultii]|uniref:FAD/NAD(P)-binding protein n=1 Tax=Lentilactobacillus raoultii TaxID=1987503 RepID=A0ABW3PRG2_9LACO|nr:FAD/NAD(P)-binding protein [Lentilactobacillus raoultii]
MEVGIIGAGPRGILVTSQLFNQYKYNSDQSAPLSITLFDPYGIGGRVWRADQWEGLIMNTPADQITLFTDESVNMTGKVFDGPCLFEWAPSDDAHDYLTSHGYSEAMINAARHLGSKDYAPRVLYGAYIRWFYDELLKLKPDEITVTLQEDQVTALTPQPGGGAKLATHDQTFKFDKVVMSLGQQDNYLSKSEQSFAQYAEDNHLRYLAPTHPGDADLSDIPAGEDILIRGLGLSFNDYISELTLGRGGQFMHNPDGSLSYQPSGREPRIIAGSGRGIPYYPKAISEKGYGEQVKPVFLTDANMDAASINGKLPYAKFIKLLTLDMALVYYSLVINDRYPSKSATAFKKQFIAADDPEMVVKSFGFEEEDHFDWDYILDPFKDVKVVSTQDYQSIILSWLDNVTTDAKMGSKTGPLGSALELLRDFRTQIREMVAKERLSNADYINKFLGQFDSDNNFLSIGAPALRSEQLSALIRSGLVIIMAPGMQVKGRDGWFVAASPKRNTDQFRSSTLLEARLPKPNLTISANPVLEDLVNNGNARPRILQADQQEVQLPSVDVDPKTDQLRNKAGNVEQDLYIWGLSLDGLRYITAASPRPGVNDPALQTADKIAANVLGVPSATNIQMN